MEELLVIESGKTRTRMAHEPVERIVGVGKHIVGTTLAKSTEEACYCGRQLYRYSVVGEKRNQIILTPPQAEG